MTENNICTSKGCQSKEPPYTRTVCTVVWEVETGTNPVSPTTLPSNSDGGLHGFLSWALYTLVSIYILTSAIGGILSGVTGAVSSIFSDSKATNFAEQIQKAQDKGESETTVSFDKIKKDAFQLINKAENYGVIPDDASKEVKQTVNNVKGDSKDFLKNLDLEENADKFFNELSFNLYWV